MVCFTCTHITHVLFSQDGKWEEVYTEVAAREMEILGSLTNGQALEEHMEDFYLGVSQIVACSQSESATICLWRGVVLHAVVQLQFPLLLCSHAFLIS